MYRSSAPVSSAAYSMCAFSVYLVCLFSAVSKQHKLLLGAIKP